MDQDQDLERCDDNGDQNSTRGDRRRQRRVTNQPHGTCLRPRRIVRPCRVEASTAGTANFAAHLASLVGLLFSLISILINLIQVKYQNSDASDPYKTHPLSMAICLAALCICAFAVGFKMIVQTGNWAAYIINRTILISGVLVIAAIVSVLVTNRHSWIIYIIWAIFSVMIVAWNSIQLIKQWRLYKRTENVFLRVINVFRGFKERLMINVGRRMLVEPQGPSNV